MSHVTMMLTRMMRRKRRRINCDDDDHDVDDSRVDCLQKEESQNLMQIGQEIDEKGGCALNAYITIYCFSRFLDF